MPLLNTETIQNTLQVLPFTSPGDHTSRLLSYEMKKYIESTHYEIKKTNQQGSGSIPITASFDGNNTSIKVRIDALDTCNLETRFYPYSLNSTSQSNSTDTVLLWIGYNNLLPNVQNPNDTPEEGS